MLVNKNKKTPFIQLMIVQSVTCSIFIYIYTFSVAYLHRNAYKRTHFHFLNGGGDHHVDKFFTSVEKIQERVFSRENWSEDKKRDGKNERVHLKSLKICMCRVKYDHISICDVVAENSWKFSFSFDFEFVACRTKKLKKNEKRGKREKILRKVLDHRSVAIKWN